MSEHWDKAKGKAKEQAGTWTDDEEMKEEGKLDQAKGEGKSAWKETKEEAADDSA